MIPLTLRIKGLYSYQQDTVIDFTNLTSASLFGIFGAVGSGKSTILEAISFVLYGETERLNRNDSRSYNMMNLKSDELLIDFIFQSGADGQKYRFVYKVKRKVADYNATANPTRKNYKWVSDEWQPTEETAENILGLSYQNFKRTIIIPQGKFQEFLQLTDGERVAMLKEIFGLEKFELGHKVAALMKRNELSVTSIQGQMMNLPEFSQEELERRDLAISELEKELGVNSGELKKAEKKDKDLADLKKQVDEHKVKLNLFNDLKRKEVDYQKLESDLAEFENCDKLFKTVMASRNEAKKLYEEQEDRLTKLSNDRNELTSSIESDTQAKEAIEAEFQSKESIKAKVAELRQVLEIKALEEEINKLSNRITKGQELVTDQQNARAVLEEEAESFKAEIAELEKNIPPLERLFALQSLSTQRTSLDNQIVTATEQLRSSKEKAQEHITRITTQIKSFPDEWSISKEDDWDKIVAIISEYKEQLNQSVDQLQDELGNLMLLQRLNDLSHALTEGECCPLCGAKEHPHIYSAEDNNTEIQKKEKLLADSKENIGLLDESMTALKDAIKQCEFANNAVKEKEDQLARLHQLDEEQLKALQVLGITEAELKPYLDQVKTASKQKEELEQKVKQKEQELESVRTDLEKFTKGLSSLQNEKLEKQARYTFYVEQIKIVSLVDELPKTPKQINTTIDELESSYDDIVRNYDALSQRLQQNKKAEATLGGKITELTTTLEQNKSRYQKLQVEIDVLLQQHNYQYEVNVNNILAKNYNVKERRKELENYHRQLHAAKEAVDDAAQKVGSSKYNETEHFLLLNQIEELKQAARILNERIITDKADRSTLEQQMKRRQDFQVDLDKLLLRGQNLKTIANLFRGSGFVNFVSKVYLQNLVSSANERFHKMTRQQLTLELTGSNNFQVRDFLNNGKERSVKTLSGGQTFQAALCLALSLADHIQQLTKSTQNFFFLDEGFGSLDKEALGIVFQTLKSLKKENRIVGVISHVDDMQQEIQVNLRVTNHPENGSFIKPSWQ